MSSNIQTFDAGIITVIIIVSVAFIFMITSKHDSSNFIQDLSSSFSSLLSRHQYTDSLANDNGRVFAAPVSIGTTTVAIVTISNNNGSPLLGSTYSMIPDPTSGSGSYTIKDDESTDINKATAAIITTIPELKKGNYMVTEINTPRGHFLHKLPMIPQTISSQGYATARFTNTALGNIEQDNNININNSSQINGITYSTKFECGSIFGQEGPLRPGHYDTDISIFNRQYFPIKILWNAIFNDGKTATTNSTAKTLQPQTSTGVTCKDIRQFYNLGNNSNELVEGFVSIHVDLKPSFLNSLLSNGGSGTPTLGSAPTDEINILDVQVFYTANALESLPHTVLVNKIAFSILNDTSKKIPPSLLMKPLDITIQSQMNEISDPEVKVKNVLSERYKLSSDEVAKLNVKVINVSVGMGTMIDDHAISISTIRPQATST